MTTFIGIAATSPLWPLLRGLLETLMGRDLARTRGRSGPPIYTLSRGECAVWGQLAAKAAGPN